jgi:catalase
VQAGALYRVMNPGERQRLVENTSDSLAQVSRDDVIALSIEHLRRADPEYGARIEAAVAAKRTSASASASSGAGTAGRSTPRRPDGRRGSATRP